MSMLVDTELGQFRCVTDDRKNRRWLFECPDCHEMLPMSEDHLDRKLPIDHESRKTPGSFCSFQGTRDFGAQLVHRMQALVLMGYKPTHDEGQDCWQPSRGGAGFDACFTRDEFSQLATEIAELKKEAGR